MCWLSIPFFVSSKTLHADIQVWLESKVFETKNSHPKNHFLKQSILHSCLVFDQCKWLGIFRNRVFSWPATFSALTIRHIQRRVGAECESLSKHSKLNFWCTFRVYNTQYSVQWPNVNWSLFFELKMLISCIHCDGIWIWGDIHIQWKEHCEPLLLLLLVLLLVRGTKSSNANGNSNVTMKRIGYFKNA